ncbi:MAG: ATPase [Verrucomicrobia bacterium GWF2_51_19]|nr:MAG: ATPase [Verrucomicrobia bacterium GWF2_51_19]HCJ12449.1 ATPase [Opitutae bacterium]
MYTRILTRTIQRVSKQFPILMLTGPRQVGKTTLFEMCAEGARNYVTLDDMDARSLAQRDPKLFLQTYTYPLIIDEVQYAPQLFSAIKIIVDREKKNGLFWLTGSQKYALMKGVTESLAGRVAILDLLGLSQSEREGRDSQPFLPTKNWVEANRADAPSLQDIYKRIWEGSFPRVCESGERDIFYHSYIQTYLQRDVPDVLGVHNAVSFYKFLSAIAARTGQMLNYTDLARDVGIDNKTAKAWLSVLQTSGLVYLLEPYYANVTKRLIKAPKIYFLDTGLCCYLTKWPTPESLEAGAMSGAILETYLFIEILKSYWHNGLEAHFYYYRDADKREIDLLIDSGNMLYPIEFKKTATPSHTASQHFHVLQQLSKEVGPGAVLCLVEKAIPLSETVMAIPLSYL